MFSLRVATGILLAELWHLRRIILATQADLAQQLRDLKAANERDSAEQQAAAADNATKLDNLQTALDEAKAAGNATTPEVDTAFAELKSSFEARDALTPTGTPVPPVPDPVPPVDPSGGTAGGGTVVPAGGSVGGQSAP